MNNLIKNPTKRINKFIVMILSISFWSFALYPIPLYTSVIDDLFTSKEIKESLDLQVQEFNKNLNIDKIIIVYDQPLKSINRHAEVMMNILEILLKDIHNKKILHIPYKYIDGQELLDIVNNLVKNHQNRKIYINLATSENRKFFQKEFKDLISEFAERNITITFATGNTYEINNTVTGLSQSQNSLFDKVVWSKLNKNAIEIKKLAIENMGFMHKLRYLFCGESNSEIKKIVEDVMNSNEIAKFNVKNKNKNKIIKHYIDILNMFSTTAFLQENVKSKKIIFVSAHTPFLKKQVYKDSFLKSYNEYRKIKKIIPENDIAQYDNNYSLDCRIEGLVNYKMSDSNVRNFGQYYNKKIIDKSITGTSISAPIELAKIIHKENK